MAHHGDADVDQRAYRRRHRRSTFELHGVTGGLLHDAPAVPDRLGGGDLVGEERHVAPDHRAPGAASDELRVVDPLLERGGESALPPGAAPGYPGSPRRAAP